jgi:predicted MPP superfamily phosphohydrolase
MKLAWLTDIHLNFIDDEQRKKYYQEIISTQCNAVLISGDIAEAPSVVKMLNEMAKTIKMPIYFVLGNHDYYRGQIDDVREVMTAITKPNNFLFWLGASGIHQLNDHTVLLGQDGWADGRLGDYQNSRVVLNDSRMIADLLQAKFLGKYQLLDKMQQLADADAVRLKNDLNKAHAQKPKKIIVLTHVPPFKEACMYEGKISADDWLPFFSSKITGDVLMQAAQENPGIEYLVLCGHTHGKAEYQCLDNLLVRVGAAEYYEPGVQGVVEV